MNLPRRHFLRLAVGAATLPTTAPFARAQPYPARPVRLIVGFPAGGAADLYARLIGQLLSVRFGQQFIIENRIGAATNIGTEAGIKAPPDGYTLFLVTVSNAANATLYEKLSFDIVRDIAPVAGIMRGTGVLVVHPSGPLKSVRDLIAIAKANRGKLNMASAGNGSPQHLYGELFKSMAGVDLTHVPYRGGALALNDLIGGRVDLIFDTVSTAIEHIRAGQVRPLAVTDANRWVTLPDLPTVAEFVPGYEASGWIGLAAPRNTPAAIIETINREINSALAEPKIIARFAEFGTVPLSMTSADFGRFVAAETEKWGKVIRAANIKGD